MKSLHQYVPYPIPEPERSQLVFVGEWACRFATNSKERALASEEVREVEERIYAKYGWKDFR